MNQRQACPFVSITVHRMVQVLESSSAVVLRFASAEDKSQWQSHLTQAAYSASVSVAH